MKKFFNNQIVRHLSMTCALVAAVLAFVAPSSCRLTEEGIEILPSDTTAPFIESFAVTSANSVYLDFSEPAVLDSLTLTELDSSLAEGDDWLYAQTDSSSSYAVANVITYSEDGKSSEIEFSEKTEIGKAYVFSGIVYDTTGNSMTFSQKFYGFNERPARLILNEVRTTFSKTKEAAEYVEFFALNDGNTYGLEFLSLAGGDSKKYSFPVMEVKKGEYITLHGRIFDGTEETALDETGENMALSSAVESCDTARDLWKSGNDKIASNTDILILRDITSGNIMDSLLLSVSGKTEWPRKSMRDFANTVFSLGLWKGGYQPENAVCTDGMTSSLMRSISRMNTAELAQKYADCEELPLYISSSNSDWSITDKSGTGKNTVSGATPGFENSTNLFTAK
ncbi:hypothetical protein [uncultured Treponema sp.]|uniref:hypothetical protein n=1 Tax=uncultured Treponema sp. TaxID=162155 RepID=UPI0025CEDD99|nr:hypothetical protein [uncultured Treponema sp.]